MKVYPGAPHGLCTTHKDKVNADLLAFLKAQPGISAMIDLAEQDEVRETFVARA